MSCRCKAEFCYRCGTKWRNCNCGDYDEPHLDIRAARGVEIRAARRAAQNRPLDPRPYEQQVAELQQRLQVGCDHNNFNYEGGKSRRNPGYCEICEYRGWKYIFRCVSCRFTACQECHSFLHWNGGDNPQQDFVFGRRHGGDDTDDDTDDTFVSEDDSN